MGFGVALNFLLLAGVLCLHRTVYCGYVAVSPSTSPVNYDQTSSSGTVRTFPNQTNIPREDYVYFFNDLNFNIDSRLLTGAADQLYLFDLDLNVQSSYDWMPSAQSLASCYQANDNSSFVCRNHIRIFKQLPSNDRQLLVCGTQADTTPQCRIVEFTAGDQLSGFGAVTASDGLLSFFPEYTSFGEFLSESNSSDSRYFSAAFGSTDRDFRIAFTNVSLTDSADPNTLQTSELFRTINTERWLDFPVTFVDYYRADYRLVPPATLPEHYQFYFVFLREHLTTAESDVIYSRVARICRNDPGISSSFGSHFTTFMKARIFCEREVPPGRQFAGTVDYQYNEIKSMVFNDEGRYGETTEWVKMMYGAFAGPSIGPVGSAVCVYRADNGFESGQTRFNRGIFDIFREDIENTQGGEVESTFVECRPGGRTSADSQLVQVVQDVSQIGENPLLVLNGLIVTQMALDQVCVLRSSGSGCLNQDILFLGTDTGKILKVVFVGSTADTTPVISEEIALDDGNAVNQLSLKTIREGSKYIYASTFSKIYRLPLERCNRFNYPNNVTNSCRSCIAARDPYCVWNVASLNCEANPFTVLGQSTNLTTSNYLQDVHSDEVPLACSFPEVGFTQAADSVSESETSYTVTIRTSAEGVASNGLVEIYTLKEGSANAGMDYEAVTRAAVVFSPNSREAVYNLTLIPDDIFEGGDEQLTIGLGRASDSRGVVISQGWLTLSIIEDDTVALRFESSDVTVSEGVGLANLTIEKDGETTVDSTVLFSTVQNGLAIAGEDFVAVETEVNILSNETRKAVTVPLVNDDVQELSKWFQAQLNLIDEQVGEVLSTPEMVNITVVDDDYVGFGFERVAYTTSETEASVEVAVVKYGSSTLPLSVRLSTMSESATSPQDFTEIASQDISFTPGERRQTVSIAIVDDGVLEDAEQLFVVLMQIDPQTRVIEAQNMTTITITDNDFVSVRFIPLEYEVTEADGLVNISVVFGETQSEVVVGLTTIPDTASGETDFTPLQTMLTASSAGPQTVTIQLVNDNVLEDRESFNVKLFSTDPRVSLQQLNVTTVFISDDDDVLVGFDQTSYTVSEGDCFVTLDVSLSGLAAVPLTFNLSTTSDVAIVGQDFVCVSMTLLTINPGTVLSQATIQLIDDNEVEMAVESFTVMLEPSSEGVLRNIVTTNSRTTIYIQDDDTTPRETTANSPPTTSSVGRVNDETGTPPPINIVPCMWSLTERCMYVSFTTSVVVLGVLLGVILILLVLLVVSFCVIAKKIRSERQQKYRMNNSDIALGLNGKRASPDRLPLESFGISNRVYLENSQPNTPLTLKHIDKDPDGIADVLWTANHDNGKSDGETEEPSSTEDLSMTKL